MDKLTSVVARISDCMPQAAVELNERKLYHETHQEKKNNDSYCHEPFRLALIIKPRPPQSIRNSRNQVPAPSFTLNVTTMTVVSIVLTDAMSNEKEQTTRYLPRGTHVDSAYEIYASSTISRTSAAEILMSFII